MTDKSSIGSNFKLHIKNQGDSTLNQSYEIEFNEKSSYSYEVLKDSNYTLYVTCNYDERTDVILKSSYSFQTKSTSIFDSIGLSFKDKTISYDSGKHYLFAYLNNTEISGDYYNCRM